MVLPSWCLAGRSALSGCLDESEVPGVVVVGGCTPRGGPAPASHVRTAACLSPECLGGGLPCPLEPGDGGHRGMPTEPRGKRWSQRSRPSIRVAGHRSARVPGWWAERFAAGGRACRTVRPDPSTLGVDGRTRLPPRGSLVGPPEPPESVSAQSVLAVTMSDLLTIC
jgi:hypothetical protein